MTTEISVMYGSEKVKVLGQSHSDRDMLTEKYITFTYSLLSIPYIDSYISTISLYNGAALK